MESLRLLPLHHGFYDGVRGAFQLALVPIGVQWVGELCRTTEIRRLGSGPANRGSHSLNPL